MLAYYLHDLNPFVFRFPSGFGLRWYGLAYIMAFAGGYWLYKRLAEKGYSELPSHQVADFILQAALWGVLLGGRLGYVLFYDLQNFLKDPLLIFKVWKGGMSSHGGILGLVFFTLYYARRHKIAWTGLGDNLVVVAPIGLFFGRIANFINGELYGRITGVPWAVQFPKELWNNPVLAQEAIRATKQIHPSLNRIDRILEAVPTDPQVREVLRSILPPRHPSQLYEAFLEGTVLFSILWFLRARKRRMSRGLLTGIFFILYAAFRIPVEMFREPDAPLIGPFTRGQLLSFFLIPIGIVFILHSARAGRRPMKS